MRCLHVSSDISPKGAIMAFEYNPETGPVISGPISRAAARLEGLLAAGAFQPQLDGSPRSKAVYAELVEPVAKGLFALAVAGGQDAVQDLTDTPTRLSEATHVNWGSREKLFAPNEFPLSAVNLWATPGSVWGPGGQFDLSAIMLEVGHDRDGLVAELTLALPSWTTSPDPAQGNWFALIGFNTRGHVREESIQGYIEGNGYAALVERRQALKYLLGLDTPDAFRHKACGGSGVTSALGFPFAEETLVAKMPLLKEYLVGCAKSLGKLND